MISNDIVCVYIFFCTAPLVTSVDMCVCMCIKRHGKLLAVSMGHDSSAGAEKTGAEPTSVDYGTKLGFEIWMKTLHVTNLGITTIN